MLAESMRRISGLLQSGHYGAAHEQLTALVAANPDYVEGLRLLAGTTQSLGDPVQAEALLRRDVVLVDHPQRPELDVLGIIIIGEAEGVEGVEPAVLGVAPFVGFAHLDHMLSFVGAT